MCIHGPLYIIYGRSWCIEYAVSFLSLQFLEILTILPRYLFHPLSFIAMIILGSVFEILNIFVIFGTPRYKLFCEILAIIIRYFKRH